MIPIDRFERQLPMALTDLAVPRTPDYLTDILGRTARTRQRPAWASIERWLPMQLATSRVPMTRMPWRQVGVLALLVVLLAVAVAAYVGSQPQRRLPPSHGPAANGSILYAADGDIYAADPRTGATRLIVGGPETDILPVYSLDGARVAFGRKIDGDASRGLLFVSRDDGSALVQLTREPLRDLGEWSFSPDGRSILAFAMGDQGRSIVVIPSDGTGAPRFFPVFATRDDGPAQYRPDGSEIMFIGQDPGAAYRGVYALDPATAKVRTLVAPAIDRDIHGASWSPDGGHIAVGMYDPANAALSARTHVVAADGTADVVIDTKADSVADWGFAWSNDGTRLVVSRFYDADRRVGRSAILPIDRSSAGIEIDCPPVATSDDCTADWSWSPDDSLLLGTLDIAGGGTSQFLADPLTGKIRGAPWTATGHPTWQRLAR